MLSVVKVLICSINYSSYHWHDALELIYVMQGTLHINLSEQTHLLGRDMIVVVNSNENHRIFNGSEDNRVLIVQLDRAWCEKILPDFSFVFFWCCSTYHETDQPEKYRQLKQLLLSFVHTNLQIANANYESRVQESANELLSYLASGFDFIRFGQRTSGMREKQVLRIKQMYEYVVDRNYQVSLSELADRFNVSLYHISHALQEWFGYSFQHLLNYSKGQHAVKLLLGTDKQISVISEESGFSDPKYVIKYFRDNYHCTPKQFRRMYRINADTAQDAAQYTVFPAADYIALLSLEDNDEIPS
jgi:AraC-like DNA-binding protein